MENHVIFRTVLIVLAAVFLFGLIHYYNTKQTSVVAPAMAEQFSDSPLLSNREMAIENFERERPVEKSFQELSGDFNKKQKADAIKPAEQEQESMYRNVDFSTQKLPNDCFPKDRLTTEDLLPKDAANLKWSMVNPAGQGDVSNINFVEAGALQGINSTMGSMRNANLQIRSDPVIPNNGVNWPINMSTIPRNSALLRKPLEINGECD